MIRGNENLPALDIFMGDGDNSHELWNHVVNRLTGLLPCPPVVAAGEEVA